MMLVADVYKAQKTDAVLSLLRGCNTEVVFVPPGATSLVQPMDVVFNAPFKAAVDKLATDHLNENFEAYVRGAVNAVQRRVLLTKWVAQAWEEENSKKEMIIRSFKNAEYLLLSTVQKTIRYLLRNCQATPLKTSH